MVPILAVSRYLVHVYSELLEAITNWHVTSIFIYLNLFQLFNIKLYKVHQDQTSLACSSYGLTKDDEENIEIYLPKKNHIHVFYEDFFEENKSSYFLIQKIHPINLLALCSYSYVKKKYRPHISYPLVIILIYITQGCYHTS